MIPIFRVVYGNYDYGSGNRSKKLYREVKNSLKSDWAKNEVIHLALGKNNAALLKELGAKKVELIDESPNVAPDRISHFYNKSFLTLKAFDKYSDGEILVVDFDAKCHKIPDERMVELLRAKQGLFNGSLQCPIVSYKRKICLTKRNGGLRTPGVHPLRKCLNTSFLYCTDRKWLQDHLDYYGKYQAIKNRNRDTTRVGGEEVFIYYLDLMHGIMSTDELVENFEPEPMYLSRGITEAQAAKNHPENKYFSHY